MDTVSYLTLGCDKNRVDTERTLGSLARAGFLVTHELSPGFALVVNTCGFIDLAKEESVGAVMDAVRAKQAGDFEVVVVVGCLVERYRAELSAEIPEVDLWMGVDHVGRLADELAALKKKVPCAAMPPDSICVDPFPRVLTTPSHYAFLKIADGCNAACRFCAIPRIRGKLRSAPIDELVKEAGALEQAGAVELNLVAQDTTAYGRDFAGTIELADLIERLLAETGVPWIRILYAHPEHVSDRLIELLANEDRLLKYLDLPIQHIADPVLEAMGRRMKGAEVRALLDRLSESIPGVFLRTTFLVGHPGEGESEFEELIEFVEEGRLMWASAFAYSPEEGTVSAGLPGRPAPELAEERAARLFDAQRVVTASRLADMVGREFEVLVDEPWASLVEADDEDKVLEGDLWLARAGFMAVEVDGVVMLKGSARPGELVGARVTDALDCELSANII